MNTHLLEKARARRRAALEALASHIANHAPALPLTNSATAPEFRSSRRRAPVLVLTQPVAA